MAADSTYQQAASVVAYQNVSEQEVTALRQKTARVPLLESQLTKVSLNEQALRSEVAKLRESLSSALVSLEEEKQQHAKLRDTNSRFEAERQRLQQAREDLAQRLLVAEQRAQQLEEEQLRFEEEVQMQKESQQQSAGAADSSFDPAGGEAVEQHLREEVERERQRAAVLVAALNSAKRERDSAMQQLRDSSKASPQDESSRRPSSLEQADSDPRKAQIDQLKAIRDKLLAELDAQNEETERLAAENAALAQAFRSLQAVINARKLCGAWENQANDGIVQIDQLKDLLEESSVWESPAKAAKPRDDESPSAAAKGDTTTAEESKDHGLIAQQLEFELAKERAKSARLDLVIRALAAEVTRAASITADERNAALPLLTGLEGRLKNLLKTTAANLNTPAG